MVVKRTENNGTLHEITEQAKRRLIEQRLIEMDGNRFHTARSLGISRQHLHSLIKNYEIPIPPQEQFRSDRWWEDRSGRISS